MTDWLYTVVLCFWAAWWGWLLADHNIARAEVVCPPCEGFDVGLALDRKEIVTCVPFAGHEDADRLEYEVRYDVGETFLFVAGADCRVTFPLVAGTRAYVRSRYCNESGCGGWSLESEGVGRLDTTPVCVGDLNGDGQVNGADFILFRGGFIKGVCE